MMNPAMVIMLVVKVAIVRVSPNMNTQKPPLALGHRPSVLDLSPYLING
jgi:hypothetical protein